MSKAYRCFCLWLLMAASPVVAAAGNPAPSSSGSCDHTIGFYADSHYRVRQITVNSPFDYLHSLQTVMRQAVAANGPKPGSEYTSGQVTAGENEIRAQLNDQAARLHLPVSVNVVTAEIRDCRGDTDPPTLNVAYYAFVSWFPFSPIATLESREAIPEAESALQQAMTELKNISGSIPDALSESYGDCSLAVIVDRGYLEALAPKTGMLFGRLNALQSLSTNDEDGSIQAISGCLQTFRAQIGATVADSAISRLTAVNRTIQQSLAKIDITQATGKAAKDTAFVKRTVSSLLYEMNLASISPVVSFDAARIGPQPSDSGGGFRYGIGGGARATFLDALQFTAGYAWNPTPKPWEGRGAAFFGVEILRPFH